MENKENNFGFSQEKLREILVDEGIPLIQIPDGGPLLVIKCKGEGHWINDDTIFYVEEVTAGPKPSTLRDKFNEHFQYYTGWDPSEYSDKQYVEDLWDFWQAGRDSGDENDGVEDWYV